ncbi:MAG: transcriptional regulator [Firmicutes bacterium HGW-Firmicutes-2]|jgi:transcriptional regulator with XRE-family HTH domain|nr:MAG: transcriptional regulator [Firmicutes bacterium HGW-Firmicutes-2]
MSFGVNLQLIRKERGMTQEQLAEMLDISRQAVSKWEAGNGYPETDKLVLLSKKLNISLDYLMDNEPSECGENIEQKVIYVPSGKIAITMFDGSQIVNCMSVRYSKILAPGNGEPPYILSGIDQVGFFGAHTVILGWYEDVQSVKKEISEIAEAINKGMNNYKLKYYTNVKFMGILGIAKKTE